VRPGNRSVPGRNRVPAQGGSAGGRRCAGGKSTWKLFNPAESTCVVEKRCVVETAYEMVVGATSSRFGCLPPARVVLSGAQGLPLTPNGSLAQLVRAFASHARGRWFESSKIHRLQAPNPQRFGAFRIPGLVRTLGRTPKTWSPDASHFPFPAGGRRRGCRSCPHLPRLLDGRVGRPSHHPRPLRRLSDDTLPTPEFCS
jgi:hypothetical protein